MKKHFKLYKSGKNWLIAGIVTLAAGLTFSVTSANADTIADNNSQVDSNVQQTQVIKNSNDVDSNSGQQAFSSAVSNQNEVSTGSQTNSISIILNLMQLLLLQLTMQQMLTKKMAG